MPFGSLSPEQRIRILLDLAGGPEYVALMNEASASTGKLAASQGVLARETRAVNTSTFVQRQGLYTLRRYAFYATTAIVGLAAEVVNLGFQYENALQTSRVALSPVIKGTQALNNELSYLYRIAALSPFLFKDTVVAFRQLYAGFHTLGLSANFTNTTIKSLIDALSYAGKTTPSALNRVSVALQHMAFMGRPAGQTILQLARDGVPIYAALHKELGLTDTQMKNIANSGVTAKQVISALNKFIATTPGYMNAALRQANKTLSGSWQQFKDILSQGAGTGTIGLFGGLKNLLAGVNTQLAPMMRANKPITLLAIADAIDKQLSPKSHLLINTFITLQYTLKTFIVELGTLLKSISLLLYPIDRIGSLFGANRIAAKLLGIALGTLITLWTIAKIKTLAFAEAEAIAEFVTGLWAKRVIIANTLTWLWTAALYVASAAQYQLAEGAIFSRLMTYLWTAATYAGYTAQRLFALGLLALRGEMAMFWASTKLATAGVWSFTAALLANPITWIVLAVVALTVGLVILYIKWKAFHDLVNKTFDYITKSKLVLAAAMMTIFGPMIAAADAVRYIFEHTRQIENFGKHPINAAKNSSNIYVSTQAKGVADTSWMGSVVHWLKSPHLATGGTLTSSGSVFVGERGPEILNLPRGATVTPIDTSPLAGTLAVHVYPQHIYMDGKKVGEAVSVAYQDAGARA